MAEYPGKTICFSDDECRITPGEIYPVESCPHHFRSGVSAWVETNRGRHKMCVRCLWVEPNINRIFPNRWEAFLYKQIVKWLERHGFFEYAPELKRRLFS